MADFFRLIKIEMLSLFGINKVLKSKDGKEKRKLGIFLIFSLVALGFMVFISVSMNVAFANIYNELGGPESVRVLSSVMYTMVMLLILVMAIHNVNGVLFGFKDYEILMSLPIKNRSIIAAKLFYMYLLDLASTMIILIPSFILYGWFNDLGAVYYLVNSLLLFFIPLVPLSLALVVGTLIAFISSRMKGRNIIEIIFSTILLIGIFALNSLGEKQVAEFGKMNTKNPFAYCYMKASCDLNLWYILGIIGVSILSAVIVFVILNRFYKPLNSALMSKGGRTDFVYKDRKAANEFPALFKREVKRYFGLPVYVLNTMISGIVGIGIAVIAFLGNNIAVDGTIYQLFDSGFKELTGNLKVIVIMFSMLPILIAGMCAMSPTTSSSVSLEGKTYWILKSSPVSFKKITTAKLLLDYMIFLPIVTIAEILICVFIKTPVYVALLVVLTGCAFTVFSGTAGLLINIYNHNFEWNTEAKPIKQSIAVVYTMAANWIFCLLLGGLTYLVYHFTSYLIATAVSLSVCVLADVIAIVLLYTKGVKRFEKISV